MNDRRSRHSRTKPLSNEPDPGHLARNIREIVESIAIAFVLAFLFRTFEAEAFVIPTGSMAPTLQGRHKDIYCPECGYRFQASASAEDTEQTKRLRAQLRSGKYDRRQLQADIAMFDTVAVTCPICRHTIPVSQLNGLLSDAREMAAVQPQPSYNGDRILVSKFAYEFTEPKRWDVVVFKYPGDGNQNYIKRLVGLPGEVIKIFQGDIFVKNRQGGRGPRALDKFTIERKPPRKVLSLMQLVHDTDHDPSALRRAGWPLRWAQWPADGRDSPAGAWKVSEKTSGQTINPSYTTNGSADGITWLRYSHYVPDMDDWLDVGSTEGPVWDDTARAKIKPQLITDMYAYNTEIVRQYVQRPNLRGARTLRPSNSRLGMHWVGDLLVECEVEVIESRGALLLDLVEAGKHFTCTIELASGDTRLSIDSLGQDTFAPSAQTPVRGPGTYRLRFGNVDDQLLLWVNGSLIHFDNALESTEYDADSIFGDRSKIVPKPDHRDPHTNDLIAGDLSPVGIGSRGAALEIRRLRVLRDLYYIAATNNMPGGTNPITDLPRDTIQFADLNVDSVYREGFLDLLTHPETAESFLAARHAYEFSLKRNPSDPDGDQFFVLGDNSPSSLDCRLWAQEGQDEMSGGIKKPGGAYVERKLLIGKALFVFWPHSWNRIPGIGIPLPFFPNFGDMRRIQ
ncbi:MAG: signal peptidase I [Pirellulales bacterium]|nr:signal peptidase I [Pirellulales bacterium]